MKEELTKLIESAIRGDSGAFERLMELEAQHIFYVSLKLMGNPLDAEDAAQEAMLKMYRRIGELQHAYAFQRWLSQTVTRTCLDMKKKLVRIDHDYLETKDDLSEMRREFLPQEYIEDVNKREFLMAIIDDLPERYRVSLLLFYYEGMSYQEIAAAMETTEKNVDNCLLRAKKKIRRELEARFGDINPQTILQGAALPILGQAFQMEAVTAASPEVLTRLVGAVKGAVLQATSGAAGASVGTATTAAGQSTATATGLGASSKILIGMVAAATAVSGTAYYHFQGNEALAEHGQPAATQEEAIILTLEDMIGQEAADKLRAYVAETEAADQWPEYLAGLSMTVLSGLTIEQTVYTLYHLEKQDKQLLILERQNSDGLGVAFHFTDRFEEPPKKGELMRCFVRWQQ